MNKRQRKKVGLKPRPSKTVRRSYWKYIRQYELSLHYALDRAIQTMTVQECQQGDFSKLNEAANKVVSGFFACKNPWGDMEVLNITKQIPGSIHKVKLNALLSM